MFDLVESLGGSISAEHGHRAAQGRGNSRAAADPVELRVMHELKRALDPKRHSESGQGSVRKLTVAAAHGAIETCASSLPPTSKPCTPIHRIRGSPAIFSSGRATKTARPKYLGGAAWLHSVKVPRTRALNWRVGRKNRDGAA